MGKFGPCVNGNHSECPVSVSNPDTNSAFETGVCDCSCHKSGVE